MMIEPIWLRKARTYVGQREIAGAKHNPLILRWWTAIRAQFADDETPWCAGFVGGVLEECGLRSSRSAAARSYLKWGRELKAPRVGCVCVLERGPGYGHVFFFEGWAKHSADPVGIGGNQSNMVSRVSFNKRRVLGYRWPSEIPIPRAGTIPIINVSGTSRNEA